MRYGSSRSLPDRDRELAGSGEPRAVRRGRHRRHAGGVGCAERRRAGGVERARGGIVRGAEVGVMPYAAGTFVTGKAATQASLEAWYAERGSRDMAYRRPLPPPALVRAG